jgi:hypothetical protein
MMKKQWKTITPSDYPWERAALDFIREGLPDHDPYRAWANFELFCSPQFSPTHRSWTRPLPSGIIGARLLDDPRSR